MKNWHRLLLAERLAYIRSRVLLGVRNDRPLQSTAVVLLDRKAGT